MERIRFITSLLTFYIKGEISFEKNFVRLKMPNTLLTFIPFGSKKDSVAINQIASVSTNFKLLPKAFLLGLIEAIIGFVCFSSGASTMFAGIIIMALGALTVMNSFQTVLSIETTGSKRYYLSFFIFEKSKAIKAEEAINNYISLRLNDTNVASASQAQTNAIVNAINNSRN